MLQDGKVSVEEYIGDMYKPEDGEDEEEPDWVKQERDQFAGYRLVVIKNLQQLLTTTTNLKYKSRKKTKTQKPLKKMQFFFSFICRRVYVGYRGDSLN